MFRKLLGSATGPRLVVRPQMICQMIIHGSPDEVNLSSVAVVAYRVLNVNQEQTSLMITATGFKWGMKQVLKIVLDV